MPAPRSFRKASAAAAGMLVDETLRLQSAALTAAANGIVITDRAGTIVWVNPAFTHLTGYTLEEAVGRNPRDLVKSGQMERAVYQQLWETILSGQTWQGQLVNRRKDGSFYHEEQTITPVRGADGAITHFIAIKQDLSERKQAEVALRESQAFYHSLVAQLPAGVFRKDAGGRYVFVSPWYCRLKGMQAEDFLGKTPAEVAGAEAARQDIAQRSIRYSAAGDIHHRQIMATGQPIELVEEYALADGRAQFVHVIKIPVVDADGKIIGTQGILFDISESKRVEAALRASEQKFQSVFEQAAVGVVIADGSRGRYVNVNRCFCEMVGYTAGELLQLSSHDLTHPDDLAEDTAKLAQIHSGAIRGFSREKRYRRKDGSYVWANAFVAPLDPTEARPTLRIGVIVDITERKHAEQLLREQNEILSNSHEGVMIVNLANAVTMWNRGAEAIFGWKKAEALGRPPEELLGVKDRSFVASLRAAVERDGFWSGEIRAQARDGRKLIIDCRITLVRDEAGRPRARLNFLADITEQKLLEEKFLHAQRLESVGMLAAGIAHDLNNLLTPIMFAAPMLRESLASARDLKLLDTLEQSAQRGSGLVKQILGFAHATSGELRPTQVKHLARDIVGIMEETFPKSIRLEQDIPSHLWLVQGNPTQLHQVLLNLCVNARDAMPQGGTLRVSIANRRLDALEAGAIAGARPGAWLVFEVADTGTGMSPEVLEHIWQPFFTTKGADKGTGLGLSTVRGIVASHQGFVELKTEVGQGTTFRVFLPALESEPMPPGSAAPFVSTEIAGGRGELILVVDDDAPIRDIVASILQKHGYRVESCADGVEAIAFFARHPGEVSLVVTDVDMPRLGGVALARTLLQLRPDIRIVAISGLSRKEKDGADIPAVQKLAHAFLLKPFKAEDLLGSLHRLLHLPAPPVS